ncbi:hypothetical protein P9112_000341 [Eukaryota sp. TZLM1-RC]
MSKLKVDVRKGDVRERVFFQKDCRNLSISRIRDEVFPDFPTMANTAEDEQLDCTQIAFWNKSSKTVSENADSMCRAGMKSRSSHMSRNLTDGTCFKYHHKDHLARDCPSKVKHEVNHLHHVTQYLTNHLSSLC